MEIKDMVQRSTFFSQPRNIILAILAVAALWILFPGDVEMLALLGVVIIFLFGIKRPLWAMAAILVNTLTISYFIVGTPWVDISLRLLLLLLTGFLLWCSRSQTKFELGENAKKIIIPVLILIGFSVVSNLINSGVEYTFKEFRNMLVGLLIVMFLAAVTKNIKDLKILCGVVFITITASSIIAILQHYPILPGTSNTTLIPESLGTRVSGMATNGLALSYVISVVILVIVGLLVAKGVTGSNKLFLGISLVLLGPALYFTFTRSAIVAVLFGLIALFLFLKMRIKFEFTLIALAIVIIFTQVTGILEGQYLGGRSQGVQEASANQRTILYQAGIAIAMDNPVLGIGGENFKKVAPQYSGSVDPTLLEWEEDRYWSFGTLGTTEIHNDFLGVWVSYGLFAFITYLFLYFVIIRSLVNSYNNSNRRFIRGLSIGLAAGLVAYGINAFYHNLLASFPLFWILAGFSLAIAKLVEKEKVA